MKSKEILAKEYSDSIERSEDGLVEQCFIAGYEKAEQKHYLIELMGLDDQTPKWVNVDEKIPEDERSVIIKTFDYRRPKENVTCTTLGFFEGGFWRYEEGGGSVDDGNGWYVIQWMEIPQ